MIKLQQIRKAYKLNNTSFEVLKGIDLHIKEGEFVSIMGSSGSGKSTLLQLIFGILKADFKFVRVDGVVKSKTSELVNEISYSRYAKI